jgi:hypothetical protein
VARFRLSRSRPVTHGDVARAQLREHGFVDPFAFTERRREALAALAPDARIAFALTIADQRLRAHESLPAPERAEFTLGWRPAIDAGWEWLAGDEQARAAVLAKLDEFHASPYDHDLGQDGPPDADEDAASAAIYASECLAAGGTVEHADWAAARAEETAYQQACDDDAWKAAHPELDDFAQDLAHPLVQDELARQQRLLDLLRDADVQAPETLARLRAGY